MKSFQSFGLAVVMAVASVPVSAVLPAGAEVICDRATYYGRYGTYTSTSCRTVEYESYVQPTEARPALNANATLDGNANIRSGASGTSRVLLNTVRSTSVEILSWHGSDKKWAWIKFFQDGELRYGYTHEVNLTGWESAD